VEDIFASQTQLTNCGVVNIYSAGIVTGFAHGANPTTFEFYTTTLAL
jgi:hypothetical protein